MSKTPKRKHDDAAPPLVESPDTVVGGMGNYGDDACTSPSPESLNGESGGDGARLAPADETLVAPILFGKFWTLAETAQTTAQDAYDRILYEVTRISESKEERQPYQVGGAILAYILFMYLCSWTVTMTANWATCPAHASYNESLAVSVAWRLSNRRRPQDSCVTDEVLEHLLEEQEQQEREGVIVRLNRPVTFLANNRASRQRANAPTTVSDSNATSSSADDEDEVGGDDETTNDKDARWVSLRYGHRRTYNPLVAIWRFIWRRVAHARVVANEKLLMGLENHPFPQAFSHEPLLADEDLDFLEAWSDRLTDENPEWHRRVAKVTWGGRSKWWHPHYARSSFYPLETIDGANLLFPYYQAMQPHMQDAEHVRFPKRQCSSGHCNTQVAILSTLEWRETYQPWLATAGALTENNDGWVYARGVSKPSPHGRHGLVWIRAGQHAVQNSTAYTRAIVQSVDRAIGTALRQGRVGRINVIVDVAGYEWSKIPDFHDIKHLFGIFQDHYPGRLGAIFLCNMAPEAGILFSLLKPLIDKPVLDKIYVLRPQEQTKQLETVIALEHIPVWLGGKDDYEFRGANYYLEANKLEILPLLE